MKGDMDAPLLLKCFTLLLEKPTSGRKPRQARAYFNAFLRVKMCSFYAEKTIFIFEKKRFMGVITFKLTGFSKKSLF
jgi:hypothetical protein